MTTLSVVDVESIVEDMPAQACEWDEEGGPCSSEAQWAMRVHYIRPCVDEVVLFYNRHHDLIKGEYADAQRRDGSCECCGVRPGDVYSEARL